MEKRNALQFSDGSFTVFPLTRSMDQIIFERDDADRNEKDPAHLTMIVEVEIAIIGVLSVAASKDAPSLYEALKYARRFLKPEDVDMAFIDSALAKSTESTA